MPTQASVRSKIRSENSTTPEDIITTDATYSSAGQSAPAKRINPIADLIDDETFAELERHKLIDTKSLRDYRIRKSYRDMRGRMSSSDAIERLQKLHPYLQFDTIRKIVYHISKAS